MRRTAFVSLTVAALSATGCAAAPELPDVQPSALTFDVGTRPDFQSDMISCLAEQGWTATPGSDNSYKVDNLPTDQYDQYAEDNEACLAEFGYDQPPSALTDAQVREVYQHMLWEWKCLDEEGYGPETPLSEQAYLDDYHANGSLWTPYSRFTSTLSESELKKLFETCPREF